MGQSKTVRVGIVEGHVLLREALISLLSNNEGIAVVGQAGGPDDVVQMVETHQPDAVLLLMDGTSERELALLNHVSELAERTYVLVVAAQIDAALHSQAIELGARGVVLLDQPGQVLVKALRKVCEGEIWLDRSQTAGVLNRLTRRRNHDDDPDTMKIESLTPREREIVGLVTEGLTNKDIAERLFISEATARNHLTSILDKLDVPDRFQLTVYAFRHGLVLCPQTPAMLRAAATMNAGMRGHRDERHARPPHSRRNG